jgi:hypothetical protein
LLIANNLDATTYYWFNMNTSISTTSPTAEIENVTQLLYDVSTVIQKDFGTGGYVVHSGGRTDEVKDHFEYVSSDTEFVLNPPINDIIGEINNERPCMLYIENWNGTVGHAVALDGYRWMNGKFQVHLNLGWGGTADGWYVYNESINASSYVFNGTIRGLMFIRLAPFIPKTPNGPSLAHPGSMVKMNTSSSSHRDLPLYYQWDWGDGTFSRWLGRYESGAISEVTHSWHGEGTYNIRVRCMNTKGYRSEWSRPHTIMIFSTIDRYIDMVKARLMQGKTGDPFIDMKLVKTIDHLDNSIDDKYWDDGLHPDAKYGHRAFVEHKAAVQNLQELNGHKNNPDYIDQLSDDTTSLVVNVDQYIAKLVLKETANPNQEYNKHQKQHQTRAEDAYEDGIQRISAGDPAQAVDLFRNCWHHATKI